MRVRRTYPSDEHTGIEAQAISGAEDYRTDCGAKVVERQAVPDSIDDVVRQLNREESCLNHARCDKISAIQPHTPSRLVGQEGERKTKTDIPRR